ncbi:MAG: UvrD-helicase domain-containing protein, partial [Novosphingobium sp.]|nr:UvrD-helicase domain-containing protein [Novosphingobium sp.]
MSGKVFRLDGAQADAVNPQETVWLSASAGTGKTQVLSARVLRLLLERDVSPSQVLCLTFTKAGAAEMAVRINEVLANWVRMKSDALARDLQAIGADIGPETQARARTLFTRVLDCPGGGLRIDTIHAFSQWLLSAFPGEAGLTPGTRAMEDRDRELLARQVLAEMLTDAEQQNDRALLGAMADFSLRKGPEAVEAWLMQCANARDAWIGKGAWMPPMRSRVNQLLGMPSDADETWVAGLCSDDSFDVAAVRQCHAILAAWDSKTGRDGAESITAWLGLSPQDRVSAIGSFYGTILNKDGTPKQLANIAKRDPHYPDAIDRVIASVTSVAEAHTLLTLAAWLTPALELGYAFAMRWDEAKAREGYIDFDDQIRRAADLLNRADMGAWIRYKLDRRFDHILVDEAQDTNAAQWDIINALTGDFFAGAGQHDDRMRTLFVVGDYKQAIFRFQGTSPENFRAARERVREQLAGAFENAGSTRGATDVRTLQDLGLGRSFRTAQPVLEFVDAAIAQIGVERFGLQDAPEPHRGEARQGLVVQWPVIGGKSEDDDSDSLPPDSEDEGAEAWLSKPDRQLADRIATQVRHWMDTGFPLVKGESSGARRAGPGDVMVLVRKRKELAGLIVARLHARGVPVAGVDRLRLGAPLGVKDAMAALRFAAQPLDDLNLANLLVSPLIGWSQQDLLDFAFRPRGVKLWQHLRKSREGLPAATVGQLNELLSRADYETPQAMLHWVLTGPWNGRRKLVARLGREVNDPLDELINATFAYASVHPPSLAGFIQWFDAGDGELKREAGGSSGMVRVMTVHGSKGLQAPIVILADAAGNPDASPVRGLALEEPIPGGGGRLIPLPALSRQEKAGPLIQAELAAAKAEREEHWRLLYVAMTRAEEALFIAGSLGVREKAPAPESWYAQLTPLFDDDTSDDPVWGSCRTWGGLVDFPEPTESLAAPEPVAATIALPDWCQRPVAAEPRPPRPLAPSSAGDDASPDPPSPAGLREDAARRGVLIHRLLERLPELRPADRGRAAEAWLGRQASDLDTVAREEIVRAAITVLEVPEWT